MRGEVCVGFASVLSFASMVMLIFVHVRGFSKSAERVLRDSLEADRTDKHVYGPAKALYVNASGYGDSLAVFIRPDNVTGLYTLNASAPLQERAGLRQHYEFGLYSYCAFVDVGERAGICSNKTIGTQFRPYDALTGDMALNYSILTNNFLPALTFSDGKYTGSLTKAAYWMLLLGTVCAALALLTGIAKNNLTFFVSAIFSIVGSILLLIGASIWTIVINKSASINDLLIFIRQTGTQSPVGISVSMGTAMYLTWAAFACLFASVFPYLIRVVKTQKLPSQEQDHNQRKRDGPILPTQSLLLRSI
ncbi:hypothetical protein NLJ89_g3415 [Agrocybe chaxingu]|uniref:Uncharacterized protein n=1 Tax=Agrocybe chaxingu TaxID=84603 RepID=A0A9W8MVI6_9AGAR|nr:hypothetical protein NLJ89_g3415 [Agrocybe chaxingu]